MSNQDEDIRQAIRRKKARIEEIQLILSQPRTGGGVGISTRTLIEEKVHLQEIIDELKDLRERLRLQDTGRLFSWEDIDQRILSAKTNEVAEEMHRRVADARRSIAYETAKSGNSAGYLPRWFAFHETLADEWAKRLYAAHSETCAEQNREISPSFIRSVRDRALTPLFGARKSSARFEAELRARRINDTGNPQNSAAIGAWNGTMDRLATRWARKLEAEAAAAEHRITKAAQVTLHDFLRLRPAIYEDPPSPPASDIWRTLGQEFRALAEEELKPGNTRNRRLRADVTYEEAGSEYGDWTLRDGPDEGFKGRFAVAASRAGMALQPSVSGKRFPFWLHHVFLDLLEHNSKLQFAGTREQGGIILRACEASAISCSRLEQQALESESANSSPREPVSTLPQASGSPRPGRSSVRPIAFVNFAGKLWLDAKRESENANVTAEQLKRIAGSLDEQGHTPPAKYLERRCARALKTFNSKNSNSKTGAIQTWVQLVAFDDKDHLRGMRRLLSRCAETLAQ